MQIQLKDIFAQYFLLFAQIKYKKMKTKSSFAIFTHTLYKTVQNNT